MAEEIKMSEVVEEIKGASEDELKEVIEKWFEDTRTQGMKIGAQLIAAAVYGAIQKNLKNGLNSSHRDYERAIKRVVEIVSVQLTQDDYEVEEITEEEANDGTAGARRNTQS
jgi:hypothetical protein